MIVAFVKFKKNLDSFNLLALSNRNIDFTLHVLPEFAYLITESLNFQLIRSRFNFKQIFQNPSFCIKLDVKKSEEKSTTSEAATWRSRSAELYHRACGGKLGTPGVKWVQLFLMYLHSWSPGVLIYPHRP